MDNKELRETIENVIDSLKTVTQSYSLGNSGYEYEIITYIFLYKFLSDKFAYCLKKVIPDIAKAENWITYFYSLPVEEQEDILLEVKDKYGYLPIFKKEYLYRELKNKQNEPNFASLLDQTLVNLNEENEKILYTQTSGGERHLLFKEITTYIRDGKKRNEFAKALINNLADFSFENSFDQGYDFFSTIFEYIIKDYNNDSGSTYAEYYTPNSIARIMARLLVGDKKDFSSIDIYDPSAGTGTLLIALANQIGTDVCTIFSQDISMKSTTLLQCNLILNDLVHSLKNVHEGNTLTNPSHKMNGQLRQFDFIVSNPPFKLDMTEYLDDIASQKDRFWCVIDKDKPKKEAKKDKKPSHPIYAMFIQHIVNSLKDEGKAAIVLPKGFLTAKTGVENNVLTKLIADKLVYGVIAMPSNLFATTGTNVAVIFLKKSKTPNDSVILIDASNLGKEESINKNKKTVLEIQDVEKIINTFENKTNEDEFSVHVQYSEIEKKNCLSPGQYFEIKNEIVDMTKEEFETKMNTLKAELENLFKESNELQKEIMDGLSKLNYENEEN